MTDESPPPPQTQSGSARLASDSIPESGALRAGRDRYLEANGYDLALYGAPRTPAKVLGLRFSVPNPPRHREAIMMHDLHHVLLGFGTDLRGEGLISVWETTRGIRPLGWYVGSIVASGALMGWLLAPHRAWAVWRAARKSRQGGPDGGLRGSLFHRPFDQYEDLLDQQVEALREELGIPSEGLALPGSPA